MIPDWNLKRQINVEHSMALTLVMIQTEKIWQLEPWDQRNWNDDLNWFNSNKLLKKTL